VTEKEKMLAGEFYTASDPQLVNDRQKARRLVWKFNNSHPDELADRKNILKELFGKIGENIFIEPSFHCDYGYNISVGNYFFMNFGGIILDCNKVTIGDYVQIGPNVQIYSATHSTYPTSRKNFLELAFPITIGNNVWIGGGAIIGPGVTIGDNSVIGAGSVVTKNIPANVVAVGNPCRIIKEIK